MKLLIIADTEMTQVAISEAPVDVLISCGDLWDSVIERTAKQCGAALVLAVKGNHDSNEPFPSPVVNLHLKTHTLNGTTFGGFGGSWRYKPRGHHLYEQEEVSTLLAEFPPVDVFVAHNSPRHIHDRDDDVHFGFDAFSDYIERAKPPLFLHGHHHVNRQTTLGQTKIIGVYGARYLEIPPASATDTVTA